MADLIADEIHIQARIERLPSTWFQRLFLVTLALNVFLDWFDAANVGDVLPTVRVLYHYTPIEVAWLTSAVFIGAVVGGYVLGHYSDLAGRKKGLLLVLISVGVGSLLSALSVNLAMFIGSRLLTGLGFGAGAPISWTYLSEMIPVRDRAKRIGLLNGIGNIGFPAAAILVAFFVAISPYDWRYMFLISSIITLIAIALLLRVPESPRYYLTKGKIKEAEASLKIIETKTEKNYGKPLPSPDLSQENPISIAKSTVRELFSKQYRLITSIIILSFMLYTIGFYSLTVLLPTLFVAKGFTIIHSIYYTAIADTGTVLGASSIYLVGERMQRKTVVGIFGVLAGILVFGVLASTTAVVAVITAFFALYFNAFMFSGLTTYMSEVFPTRMRATADGITYGLAGKGINAVFFIIFLAIAPGIVSVLGTVAISYILSAIVLFFGGIATANMVLEKISK